MFLLLNLVTEDPPIRSYLSIPYHNWDGAAGNYKRVDLIGNLKISIFLVLYF